jgi:hypothetical protein
MPFNYAQRVNTMFGITLFEKVSFGGSTAEFNDGHMVIRPYSFSEEEVFKSDKKRFKKESDFGAVVD